MIGGAAGTVDPCARKTPVNFVTVVVLQQTRGMPLPGRRKSDDMFIRLDNTYIHTHIKSIYIAHIILTERVSMHCGR